MTDFKKLSWGERSKLSSEEQDIYIQNHIEYAIKELEESVNLMDVGSRSISKYFWGVHPHLQDKILKGFLLAIAERDAYDGRINRDLWDFAHKLWGKD